MLLSNNTVAAQEIRFRDEFDMRQYQKLKRFSRYIQVRLVA